MRKIVITSQKGGTGKTTTVVNLGVALGKLGKKVVLIDVDPESNLTYHFGINNPKHSIYDLITDKATISKVIIKKEGVSVIPSTGLLGNVGIEFANREGRELLLKKALKGLKGDYIIIDTPPALDLLTVNALTWANEVFIPLQVEPFALRGLKRLFTTIQGVKKNLNPNLEIGGVILTLYDARRRLSGEVEAIVRQHFSSLIFDTRIRENVSLAESPNHGQSIFTYAKHSRGAEDYMSLAKEMISG